MTSDKNFSENKKNNKNNNLNSNDNFFDLLSRKWDSIIRDIIKNDQSLEEFVTSLKLLDIENSYVKIGYNPKFNSDIDNILDRRSIVKINYLIEKELNRIVQIEFIPLDKNYEELLLIKKNRLENNQDNLLDKWYNHSAVNNVAEIFNSRIKDIK